MTEPENPAASGIDAAGGAPAKVAALPDDAAALAERADALVVALDAAGEQVDPEVADRARRSLDAVAKRLERGGDRTVVALVGGTGSGKSSLFNAISGLSFADVGALRPTTEVAAACVWGEDATSLLDFLEVGKERRIQRESLLDGDTERPLHGMVLLDLPDHDSIARHHANLVDRLLPLVDLLVWVVDPQKYADEALHERYLRALSGRRDAMLVLINQVDTLPEGAVERIRSDVTDLLAEDGLDGVRVMPTSAVEGTGIQEVRDVLADVVARPSVTVRTAQAEVEAVASRLASTVGAGEPEIDDVEAEVAELARAAGAESVASSLRNAGGGAVARPEPPAESTVAAVREGWIAKLSAELPERWGQAIAKAVTPAGVVREAVAETVEEVPVPLGGARRAFVLRLLGILAVLLGVGWGVFAVLRELDLVLAAAPAAALVLLGVILFLVGRTQRSRHAERAAESYQRQVNERVEKVVRQAFVGPVRPILDQHRVLREALAAD